MALCSRKEGGQELREAAVTRPNSTHSEEGTVGGGGRRALSSRRAKVRAPCSQGCAEGRTEVHPGVGGEQFPGVGPGYRHCLITIVGFLVVQVFFLECIKLDHIQRLALSRCHKS